METGQYTHKKLLCPTSHSHFLLAPVGGAVFLAEQWTTVWKSVALAHCLLSMRPLYQ